MVCVIEHDRHVPTPLWSHEEFRTSTPHMILRLARSLNLPGYRSGVSVSQGRRCSELPTSALYGKRSDGATSVARSKVDLS